MSKQIDIAKNGEKLLWLVEDNLDNNTMVSVGEGCEAIVLSDGAILDVMRAGKRKVNEKGFFERKDGAKWSIYGVNTGSAIELCWGTSSPISFMDKTLNGAYITLKGFGNCYAKVEDSQQLFNTLLKGDCNNITTDTLCDKVRNEVLNAAAKNSIMEVISSKSGFNEVSASSEEIADKILKIAKTKLSKDFGLYVTRSVVQSIKFEGQEKFTGVVNQRAFEEFKTGVVDEQKKQGLAGAEVVNAFNNAAKVEQHNDSKQQNKKEPKKEENGSKSNFKFCPKCGSKLTLDANFCFKCGKPQ